MDLCGKMKDHIYIIYQPVDKIKIRHRAIDKIKMRGIVVAGSDIIRSTSGQVIENDNPVSGS